MTRVLVLGNSHAATLRRAFPEISRLWPGLDLEFWGLPGAAFAKASVDDTGVLRPDPNDTVSRNKVLQWNAVAEVDLAAYDRIFLIGLRYGLRPAQGHMRKLHPFDWGTRTGQMGVSEGFLRAAVRAEIDAVLDAQTLRTPMDNRFVLMPAPYPASCVGQEGPLHEPLPAAVARMSHAQDLLDLFEEELAKAHTARGLTCVAQPRATLDRPFLTQDRYLEEPGRDGRHMNADYGLLAFRALAGTLDENPPAEAGIRIA